MKTLKTVTVCLMVAVCITVVVCGLFSCHRAQNNGDGYPKGIYKGHMWDIVQLNDSIYVMIPGGNNHKVKDPKVINAKGFRNETDFVGVLEKVLEN